MTQPGQAPTATPPTAGRALAVAAPQGVEVTSVATRGNVERYEMEITIPADFQYTIPVRGKRNADGSWDNSAAKVGLTADAYDYINRVLGVSFFLPEWVHDEQGERQRNPIHRKDYIYLRLGAVWYNPMGQLLLATEDVEVDFNLTWMDARINSKDAEVVIDDETGLPKFDQFGNPAVKIDKGSELKALKTLSQLRTFGPRYAQTVARVRLLKLASGLRSVPQAPGQTPGVRAFKLKVVGFRDQMTPQERIAKVGGDLTALYGRPDEVKPLTQTEMQEIAPDVDPDTEVMDREAIAARETGEQLPLSPEDEAELDKAAEA